MRHISRGRRLRQFVTGATALVMMGLVLLGCAPAVEPQPSASPATSGGLTAQPPLAPLPAATPSGIAIPAISVSSELIGLGLQADGTMEVPDDGDVAGWYVHAPTPGEVGPAVIAAHVDWNGAPGVFVDLHRLTAGDEVLVRRDDGSTAVFRIERVEQHDKDEFPTAEVYGDIDHAGLRLITCGGAFDRAERSYEDNVIAYARLVGVTFP